MERAVTVTSCNGVRTLTFVFSFGFLISLSQSTVADHVQVDFQVPSGAGSLDHLASAGFPTVSFACIDVQSLSSGLIGHVWSATHTSAAAYAFAAAFTAASFLSLPVPSAVLLFVLLAPQPMTYRPPLSFRTVYPTRAATGTSGPLPYNKGVIASINPATGETLRVFEELTDEQLDAKLANAE